MLEEVAVTPTFLVVRPFGEFKTGTLVKSIKETNGLLAGEHAYNVVRVVLPTNDQAEFKGV